jgi:hypothetical protein
MYNFINLHLYSHRQKIKAILNVVQDFNKNQVKSRFVPGVRPLLTTSR